MSRTPAVVALGATLMAAVGCGGVGRASPVPATPVTPPRASAPSTVVATTPTVAPADSPPDAALAVDGGDPVTGQLGTYWWREAGSDAPWLSGSPIAVGIGETLVVSFGPSVAVAEWSARYAPTGSDAADVRASLGDGTGPPVLTAPPAGRWTVAVTVTFADDLGEATYYWAVEVR